MKRSLTLLAPLAAALALAACNKSQPEVIDTRPADPNAAEIANMGKVELPPAMRSQKTYRCKDNTLAYVTWYQGNNIVDAKVEKDGAPTRLTSSTGTSPWTSAVGWTLAGDDTDITLTVAGKGPQTCHT